MLMTFWERFQIALNNKKLNVADLSRIIDIPQSSINSWKAKGSIPRADIAVKTALALDTNVEWLITGTNEIKLKNTYLVPLLNQELSAGNGELLPDNDVIQGLLALPAWLRKQYGEKIAALYVHGDSMQPTLNDGDMVVCDSLGWDNSDGVYAIRMNGNGYVKRIQVANNKILIISDNTRYKIIEEPLETENIQIIGKVRLVIHSV